MEINDKEVEELFDRYVTNTPLPITADLVDSIREFIKRTGKKDTLTIQRQFNIGYSQCLRVLETIENKTNSIQRR